MSGFVVPTAGNAGAALPRTPRRPGFRCASTRPTRRRSRFSTRSARSAPICSLVKGHIGDAGKQARAFAAESGYFDVSTLREPYRIEGKKTMGIELAEQLGWTLPTHIIYPTGGGTGLIGMWKVFDEMQRRRMADKDIALPRMVVAQADGCAPIVRAFHAGQDRATPWENPDDARQRPARSRSARRSLDSARVAREQGRRARGERRRDSRGHAAAVARERHRRGAGGRLRARRHARAGRGRAHSARRERAGVQYRQRRVVPVLDARCASRFSTRSAASPAT